MEGYCKACKHLLKHESKTPEKTRPWHKDIFTLKVAAEERRPEKRCRLCRLVWLGLTAKEKAQIGAEGNWPIDESVLATGIKKLTTSFEEYDELRIINFRFPLMQTATADPHYRHKEFGILTKSIWVDSITNMASTEHMGPLNEFQPTTNNGSKQSLDLVLHWVGHCISNHSQCNSESAPENYLPTRLIYTGLSGSTSARLCQTQHLKQEARYITLSHCWGKDQENIAKCNLKSENQAAMLINIDVNELPKTFQDAIFFAREIGIGYLWIDSLCIIQDSEVDWRHESSNMAAIYSNAWCNIAAAGAADSPLDKPTGLFFDREIEDLQVAVVEKPRSTAPIPADEIHIIQPGGKFMLIDNELWSREVDGSGLAKRAWVLQERLLPKRVVHFTKRQIFFECRQSKACETYPLGFNRGRIAKDKGEDVKHDFAMQQVHVRNPPAKFDTTAAFDTWARIVDAYSQCAMTFERDKLIALSGIAREMEPLFKSNYLAGLWSESLYEQLTWQTSPIAKRPSIYVAPTWSWASVTGPIILISSQRSPHKKSHRTLCSIVEVKVTTVDSDEMSLVTEGYLRIVGKLIPIDLSQPRQGHHNWIKAFTPSRQGIAVHLRDIPDKVETSTCYLIPMWKDKEYSGTSGLAVKPVDNCQGKYQRVGIFHSGEPTFTDRAGTEERKMITENLYETYDEERDLYTFTII